MQNVTKIQNYHIMKKPIAHLNGTKTTKYIDWLKETDGIFDVAENNKPLHFDKY